MKYRILVLYLEFSPKERGSSQSSHPLVDLICTSKARGRQNICALLSSACLTVNALRIQTHQLAPNVSAGHRNLPLQGWSRPVRGLQGNQDLRMRSKDPISGNRCPTETSFYEIPIEFPRLDLQFEFCLGKDPFSIW